MGRAAHQPTDSAPALVLPYTVAPPGAPPYEYEVRIVLAERDLAFVERMTPLLARLAWTTVERPAFDGVQAAESVLRAYESALAKCERAEIDEDAVTWIEAHGSRQLSQGIARGYDMSDLYIEERLAREFAGMDATCKLDGAAWRAIEEPTLAALETLSLVETALSLSANESAHAWIVRLSDEPFGFRMFRAPCWEAVLVEGWLGRHLVLVGVKPAASLTYRAG
ncbi:hypothetical protein HJD18_16430 [Thermoleophilia bacterium SCSIO 60948]|nr:hypothetical protein HJD18_16430 [Thermoleophilia bacterium SCSIO 60948]